MDEARVSDGAGGGPEGRGRTGGRTGNGIVSWNEDWGRGAFLSFKKGLYSF